MESLTQRSNSKQGLVTVIIAAFNASATIDRAINSALAEPEVSEIVVVDDDSSDDTIARARALDDGSGRIKVLSQDRNRGPAAARNWALKESSAPWISILDADDFFLSGRIAGLLKFSNKADFVADDIWQVAEDHIAGPRKSLLGDKLSEILTINFSEFVLSNVTKSKRQRGELGFIKPLMRREFLLTHQIQYRENMRLGEDYELYARALALGAVFRLVPAQGYISVLRPNSLSGQHTENDLLNLRNCNLTLQAIPNLLPQDREALRQHYLNTDCRLQWRLLISAVKKRNIHEIFRTFLRPHPVPLYLLSQLTEQAILRTSRKIRNSA